MVLQGFFLTRHGQIANWIISFNEVAHQNASSICCSSPTPLWHIIKPTVVRWAGGAKGRSDSRVLWPPLGPLIAAINEVVFQVKAASHGRCRPSHWKHFSSQSLGSQVFCTAVSRRYHLVFDGVQGSGGDNTWKKPCGRAAGSLMAFLLSRRRHFNSTAALKSPGEFFFFFFAFCWRKKRKVLHFPSSPRGIPNI